MGALIKAADRFRRASPEQAEAKKAVVDEREALMQENVARQTQMALELKKLQKKESIILGLIWFVVVTLALWQVEHGVGRLVGCVLMAFAMALMIYIRDGYLDSKE